MKKKVYLTSQQLSAELSKSQQQGKPTSQVCLYFKMIAEHLIGDSRYRRYPREFREDMVQDAILKCIKNIKNFKPQYADKSFNYFTRCVEHSFWTSLNKHYRYVNAVRQMAFDLADYVELENPQLAKQIRDSQITVEHNKDKLTFNNNNKAKEQKND